MINIDLPITDSTEDKLNRSTFAKDLAKTISNYSSPYSFAIGLYGKWGSGKTSLINMVLKNIKNINENTLIMEFNPWLCTDPKLLVTQFFKQMSTTIKIKRPKLKELYNLINQYTEIFEFANLIPVVGTYIATVGKILAKQKIEDLQEIKNQIINEIKKENIKIVISIDDIDRLSEEEIIATFQLIKTLADFPNTIYILAFDYNIVIHALNKVQYGNGKEYLEKIIQMPFEIPTPNMTSIHKELLSKIDFIFKDFNKEQLDKERWLYLFQFGIQKYIKSIRDITRYVNVLSLKYELLKDETDIIDLLGLTILQVFEPSLYSKLPSYKYMLCKVIDKTQEISDNEDLTNKDAANNILAILFPRYYVTNNFTIKYSYEDSLINNNISITECFDRYFTLTLEKSDIPTNVIKYLIYESNDSEFTAQITQFYQENKIIPLLEKIEAYAQQNINKERATLIITALTHKWNSFKDDNTTFFSIPFEYKLSYCINLLLEKIDPTDRFPYIHSIFKDTNVQPSTLVILLEDFEHQVGRFTKNNFPKDNALFSLNDILKLEKIFENRALEAIKSKTILTQYHGLTVFRMLEMIDTKSTKKLKASFISDDISLIKVINYCTSKGGRLIGAIEEKILIVNQQELSEFINIDDAYHRIKIFVKTNSFFSLSKEDQISAIAFILDKERIISSKFKGKGIAEDFIIDKLDKLTEKYNDKKSYTMNKEQNSK